MRFVRARLVFIQRAHLACFSGNVRPVLKRLTLNESELLPALNQSCRRLFSFIGDMGETTGVVPAELPLGPPARVGSAKGRRHHWFLAWLLLE